MKTIKILFLSVLLSSSMAYAQDDKAYDLMDDAQKAKEKLIEKNAIVEEFFNNSDAYVIFPNVGKGGLFVGGAFGNGILYQNNIAQGAADLKRINVGLQAGGQSVIEVVFLENEKVVNEFMSGEFEFAADASAVVWDKGAGANLKYKNGIAVVVMPKAGLMAGISIGGQKFKYESFDEDDTEND